MIGLHFNARVTLKKEILVPGCVFQKIADSEIMDHYGHHKVDCLTEKTRRPYKRPPINDENKWVVLEYNPYKWGYNPFRLGHNPYKWEYNPIYL